MSPCAPDTLIQALNWRYATKVFDPAKKISEADLRTLEESLVLTPSSFGLQPYRFLVVTDPALRARLREASWGQSQVTDCSHLLVFLARKRLTEADVDHLIERTVQVRGVAAESLASYRAMMVGTLVTGPRAASVPEWAARQAYIALGQFMASAALLGLDTCPMEGLDPARYRRGPGAHRHSRSARWWPARWATGRPWTRTPPCPRCASRWKSWWSSGRRPAA